MNYEIDCMTITLIEFLNWYSTVMSQVIVIQTSCEFPDWNFIAVAFIIWFTVIPTIAAVSGAWWNSSVQGGNGGH